MILHAEGLADRPVTKPPAQPVVERGTKVPHLRRNNIAAGEGLLRFEIRSISTADGMQQAAIE